MAKTSDGKREIIVTDHGEDRARSRFGLTGDSQSVRRYIITDIVQAIDAGRFGKRLPRVYSFNGRGGNSIVSQRCAWTADESRAYILIPRHTKAGAKCWVVKTAMVPVR